MAFPLLVPLAAAAARVVGGVVVRQLGKEVVKKGATTAASAAAKKAAAEAAKKAAAQKAKTPKWQTFDPKGGTRPTPDYVRPRPTGSNPNSGWNAYGPDAAKVPAPRAATVTKPGTPPTITPPKWDPFGPNTKPWDPYSPKTNPWPDMPKVPTTTPKVPTKVPTKVPAPTTPTIPKPATPKVPTKVPVPKPVKLPKVGLKAPGALGLLITGGALAYDYFNKPQNQPKPWPTNPTNPAPPIAPPIAPPRSVPPGIPPVAKSKQFKDQWNPSSIV